MASHDQVRKEKESKQGVGAVEKKNVPKISSHFESLTVSPAKLHDQSGGGTKAAEHGGVERARAGNVGKFEMQEKEKDLGKEADIAQYRQAAQQNSFDALRAAEERYNKAREVTSQKGGQAKDTVMQGAQRTSQYATEKGQPLYETSRDTLTGAGKTAKDYVAEKAVGAKDVVAETGKGTAGYVGSVATTVKDKAVVAGWGVGEYTAEKAVDVTKAMANVTAGAAGYVGSVGVSAKDYAAQKLAAAKDATVATQESAKDYAARKRAEAEREMQAKQSAQAKGEVRSRPTEEIHDDITGAGRKTVEVAEETVSKEQPEYGRDGQLGGGRTAEAQGGGVLHAIGETVLEIGQTTKDLLVGKGQIQSTVEDSADLNK